MPPNPALPYGLSFAPAGLPAGIDCDLAYDDDSWRLAITLANHGDASWRPAEVRLQAPLDLAAADGYAHLHGRATDADARVRRFGTADDGDRGFLRETAAGHTYVSEELLALHLPVRAAPVLIAGALRPDRFLLAIGLELDADEAAVRGLWLAFDLAGAEIAAGEALTLQVYLAEGRDLWGMIEGYADEVAEELGARVRPHIPTAWRGRDLAEAEAGRALETLRDTGHPAEVVLAGEGYQAAVGDWLVPSDRFPAGLAALADRIRAAGFAPGLWLAPFLLHADSAALREQPELALRTHDGAVHLVETRLGRCAVLDCTHPAAEAWLRALVAAVREWGYTHLELDALACAAVSPAAARYAAAGTTAPGNLRRGLEIVREAAGEETAILARSSLFGPAIGLVDAMQVGPDARASVAEWPGPDARAALRPALLRNWMHGRWWTNDPGDLVLDGAGGLPAAEARFLAAGIALSGGLVVAGDDPGPIDEDRQALALALFPPAGVAARPEDPGEAPAPSGWRATLADGRALVGVLNWDERAHWVVQGEIFRPGEVAFDAFNARLAGMGDVLLRPHEGAIWQVAGRGATPRVVGDSGSLTYDRLFVRQVSGRVQVRNDGDRARVVAIEARGQVFEVDLGPGEMRWFD